MILAQRHNALEASLRGMGGLLGLGANCADYGLLTASNGGCYDPSIGSHQNLMPAKPKATDYPSAPGCHVVSLPANECLLDDGTEVGCNAILECDPLTHANHYQFALPSGPTKQPGPIKTVALPSTSDPNPSIPNLLYAPDLTLANPTETGTPFVQTMTPFGIDAAAQELAYGSSTPSSSVAATTNPPSRTPTPQSDQPGNIPTGLLASCPAVTVMCPNGMQMSTDSNGCSVLPCVSAVADANPSSPGLSSTAWLLIAAGVGLFLMMGGHK